MNYGVFGRAEVNAFRRKMKPLAHTLDERFLFCPKGKENVAFISRVAQSFELRIAKHNLSDAKRVNTSHSLDVAAEGSALSNREYCVITAVRKVELALAGDVGLAVLRNKGFAFAENEIGYLLEDLILQGGVDTIKPYVDEFISFARRHPKLTFLVTRIGCGIAGFTNEEISPLFKEAHGIENIVLPPGW